MNIDAAGGWRIVTQCCVSRSLLFDLSELRVYFLLLFADELINIKHSCCWGEKVKEGAAAGE